MGSGDTTGLIVGSKLLISGTSSYNGAQVITGITATDKFTFASSASTTESGTMIGKTIEIDEDLTFTDTTDASNSVTVHSRWIPIEIPADDFDATPKTRITHFDTNTYIGRELIRSTMVQDNLYLTNDSDEVMKFDGTNIYRAGLFRWQPNLFVTTSTSGRIQVDTPSVSFTAVTENQFTVTSGDEISFQVGDTVQSSLSSDVYTELILILQVKLL